MSTTKCSLCAGHKWRAIGPTVIACQHCWDWAFNGKLRHDVKTPADRRRFRRAMIHMRREWKASLRRFMASL